MNAVAQSRAIDRLLGQYAESHRHPTNVLIHWICVPIIVWCVLAFAYAIHPYVAWAGSVVALVYYVTLSSRMAAVMAVLTVAALVTLPFVPHPAIVAAALFVVTWVFQFVGHHIEGKKPSFLDDVRFLMIGPLFLLGKAFRKLGVKY
jgi:uncharacterized membrane protein YGL010W